MSIRLPIVRCALGALVSLTVIWAPLASAQSAPLELKDAIARAVAHNPALRGSEYLLQATRAREAQAALMPPMGVGMDLEDFAGTGSMRDTASLQTTLQLSGVLELGGKRTARVLVAERATDIVAIEQEGRRMDLLAQVATRFAEVAARQEQLEVARESSRLAATTVERVTERIRIGAAPRYELARAEIRLLRARMDERGAEDELASSRVHLAATWGGTSADFERVAADLFELPQVKTFAQLMAGIESSPSIRILLSRERLADAQINLATAANRLDVGWSLGVRHIQTADDVALVASAAVPLGTRRRAEPGIREARAGRALASIELESARVEAGSALYRLHRDLERTRLEVAALRDEVQPRAASVLQSTEQAFRQGRTGFLEYANSQQELLEVRREAVVAAAGYHVLLIEIERLTGSSLDADTSDRGDDP